MTNQKDVKIFNGKTIDWQTFDLVEIKSNIVTVDWHFGNHCQNACSYCPSFLHANNSKKYDLEYLKNFTYYLENKFCDTGKKINFMFSGGEPTISGNFGPYIKFIKERNHSILVSSNAGRTLRWWEEYGEYFDEINLSYHPEYTDLDHFCEVIELMTAVKKKTVFIAIIVWPDKFNIIQKAYSRLKNISNLLIVNKKVEGSWIDKPDVVFQGYTDEQEKWITDNISFNTMIHNNNGLDRKFYIFDQYQNKGIVHPTVIRNFDKNKFLGWQCSMGIKNLSIQYDGNIYGAQCRQLHLGSIYDYEKIKWPTEPSICKHEYCKCIGDLMIDKKR